MFPEKHHKILATRETEKLWVDGPEPRLGKKISKKSYVIFSCHSWHSDARYLIFKIQWIYMCIQVISKFQKVEATLSWSNKLIIFEFGGGSHGWVTTHICKKFRCFLAAILYVALTMSSSLLLVLFAYCNEWAIYDVSQETFLHCISAPSMNFPRNFFST